MLHGRDPQLFSSGAVAALLGLSERTVRSLLKNNVIPARRLPSGPGRSSRSRYCYCRLVDVLAFAVREGLLTIALTELARRAGLSLCPTAILFLTADPAAAAILTHQGYDVATADSAVAAGMLLNYRRLDAALLDSAVEGWRAVRMWLRVHAGHVAVGVLLGEDAPAAGPLEWQQPADLVEVGAALVQELRRRAADNVAEPQSKRGRAARESSVPMAKGRRGGGKGRGR